MTIVSFPSRQAPILKQTIESIASSTGDVTFVDTSRSKESIRTSYTKWMLKF